MKQEFGLKILVPWADMISYRCSIIPPFSPPNWENGYLSTSVTVRDLIKTDVERILELDDVRSKIVKLRTDSNASVECVVRIAGGPDSATGFNQYNQANILGNDDSLLSENYMLLQLLKKTGEPIYENPNPQSDYFCRARSLCWTKETDIITRKMFDTFYEELDEIKDNPVIVMVHGIQLSITAEAIYSMIDGKVANAIVGNKNTHACPVCLDTTNGKIGPSFFHSRLNSVEWVIRSAAKKSVPGNPALSHPDVKLEARRNAGCLETHFKVQVNRPKPGGSGSAYDGNLARRLR